MIQLPSIQKRKKFEWLFSKFSKLTQTDLRIEEDFHYIFFRSFLIIASCFALIAAYLWTHFIGQNGFSIDIAKDVIKSFSYYSLAAYIPILIFLIIQTQKNVGFAEYSYITSLRGEDENLIRDRKKLLRTCYLILPMLFITLYFSYFAFTLWFEHFDVSSVIGFFAILIIAHILQTLTALVTFYLSILLIQYQFFKKESQNTF